MAASGSMAQHTAPAGTREAWQQFVHLLQQPNSADSVAGYFIYPIHCSAWYLMLPSNQGKQLTETTWAGYYPISRVELVQHYDKLMDAHTIEQCDKALWPAMPASTEPDAWTHLLQWRDVQAGYAHLGQPIYSLWVSAMTNLLVLFFKQGDAIVLRIVPAPIFDNRDD